MGRGGMSYLLAKYGRTFVFYFYFLFFSIILVKCAMASWGQILIRRGKRVCYFIFLYVCVMLY